MICWTILSLFVLAPQQQAPEFEVASVKLSSGSHWGAQDRLYLRPPDVNLHAVDEPLLELISAAYGIDWRDVAGPAWLSDVKVDVIAKAPAAASEEELRVMLNQLLKERFAFAAHKEMRAEPAYVLTIAKSGIKFKKNKDPRIVPMSPGEWAGKPGDGPLDRDGYPILPAHKAGGIGHVSEGVFKFTSVGMPVSAFTYMIAPQLGGPMPQVIDRTGLTGLYDFKIEYMNTMPGEQQPYEFGGPPIAEALEKQLGLHLEKMKVPVEMLIVDHIERTPTAN
jgi:uncharacterized protein (TIGR03435 family)